MNGRAGIGEFLYGLTKDVYVGARGQYRNATLSLNQDRLDSSGITFQPPDKVANVIDQIRDELLHQTTVSLGPRLQWDTRDNVFNPKHGLLMEVSSDFFSTGLGSKWSYQFYRVSFNKYNSLSEHQVLAFRGMSCAAVGDRVPILRSVPLRDIERFARLSGWALPGSQDVRHSGGIPSDVALEGLPGKIRRGCICRGGRCRGQVHRNRY